MLSISVLPDEIYTYAQHMHQILYVSLGLKLRILSFARVVGGGPNVSFRTVRWRNWSQMNVWIYAK